MPYTRPNISKSGFTVSGRRKWSKRLNYQRSMPIIVNKINSPNRLLDEEPIVEETPATTSPESGQEVSNPSSSLSSLVPSTPPSSLVEKFLKESMQLEENSQNKQLLPASESRCFCISQTPESVEDKKGSEIIEHVQQNLEEASKILATLGENNDLKVESHVQLECRKTVSMSRRRKRREYN